MQFLGAVTKTQPFIIVTEYLPKVPTLICIVLNDVLVIPVLVTCCSAVRNDRRPLYQLMVNLSGLFHCYVLTLHNVHYSLGSIA